MIRTVFLVLACLAGCSTIERGEPQWGTITGVYDRGTWGCFTSVVTDPGMTLTRRGCHGFEGGRVCVTPVRRDRLFEFESAAWWWEPSDECGPGEVVP
jgi:hypothetical protein